MVDFPCINLVTFILNNIFHFFNINNFRDSFVDNYVNSHGDNGTSVLTCGEVWPELFFPHLKQNVVQCSF